MRTQLTIVLATGAVDGGAWLRLVELLRHLDKAGYQIHLIAYDEPALRVLSRLEKVTVHPVRAPRSKRNILALARAVYSTIKGLRTTGPVLLGSYSGNAGLALAAARRRLGRDARMFVFLRGAELSRARFRVERRGAGPIRRFIALRAHVILMNYTLRRADMLIAQTERGLETVRRTYSGARRVSAVVLPNNWNTRWIEERLAAAPPSEERQDVFRVAFVGRINIPVKGLDVLIGAAERLRELPIHFDIVGAGHDLGRLTEMIRSRELEGSVSLHGWVENPFEVIRHVDIVVVPSRSDPLPNVVLECFAAGKPVIGSDIDGIEVLLEHKALLFPPGDAMAMAAALRRFFEEPAAREEMESLCRSRAEMFRFNWGARFETIVRQVAAGAQPAEGAGGLQPEISR